MSHQTFLDAACDQADLSTEDGGIGAGAVLVKEGTNFAGNIRFLRQRGVEVVLLDTPRCQALMARFIPEKPDIWFEDIAGNESV